MCPPPPPSYTHSYNILIYNRFLQTHYVPKQCPSVLGRNPSYFPILSNTSEIRNLVKISRTGCPRVDKLLSSQEPCTTFLTSFVERAVTVASFNVVDKLEVRSKNSVKDFHLSKQLCRCRVRGSTTLTSCLFRFTCMAYPLLFGVP